MDESKKIDTKVDLYGLPKKEIVELLSGWGYSKYHADCLWTVLYRDHLTAHHPFNGLRDDLVAELRKSTTIESLEMVAAINSEDGQTQKVVFRLKDGNSIETVFMRFEGRSTVCVSTQVGCAMGCVFCATGQMGFLRDLRASEIVHQVIEADRYFSSRGQKLRNVVFMGMGEPLHNYSSCLKAIDILTDDTGLAVAPSRITISTIGIVPAIRSLAHESIPVNLAVSLHAANDNIRSRLAPLNKKWSLNSLMDACRYYSDRTGRRIFFEWAMIHGKNDSDTDAHELGQLISGFNAHVNLIPYNPTKGYAAKASDEAINRRFQDILIQYGIPSTVRQKRGIDIQAGCGQLHSAATKGFAGSK